MALCPECDAELDVDEFDADKGDVISCPECGSNLHIVGLSPLEVEVVSDEDDDEDELEEEDEEVSDDEDEGGDDEDWDR